MSEVRQHLTQNQPVQQYQVEEPICIGAPVVSGIGETEVLERIVIDLGQLTTAAINAGLLPANIGPAVEAVILTKKVIITDCEAFTNKVIVNGVLHKDILFKFQAATPTVDGPIFVTPSDCTITLADTLDVVLDCPFGACIPVPGACPGDKCEVILACVDAEKDLLIDTTGTGDPDLFEEKVCILIRVKTIRQQLVTIQPVTPNLCPEFPPFPNCPPGCPPFNCQPCNQLQTTSTVQRC
jgi:hypothetical protein